MSGAGDILGITLYLMMARAALSASSADLKSISLKSLYHLGYVKTALGRRYLIEP